jgi:hypothetical protein
MAMRIRYAAAIAFILCAIAFPAFAGPSYQMVGGICTDGSTDDNGQLLCSPNISAAVEMADWYVLGTPFSEDASAPQSVAFFTFYDGFQPYGYVATVFPIDCCGGNLGEMGGASEGDFLQFHWLDGPNFDASGGRWFFSTPTGPNPGDLYFSSGTYDHWEGPRVVAEPQSLALIGIALATFVLVRSILVRSRRSRM